MMLKHWLCVGAMALILVPRAFAATYYIDPVKGTPTGDGSRTKPWRTLAEVGQSGKLAQLKGGDTVLLSTGYHGSTTFSGANSENITIAAGKGQKPTLSRLTISSGANWTVRGLAISPSYGGAPYKGSIVTLGESGPSHDITVEDCYIFTVEDAAAWGAREWIDANSGVLLGHEGRKLTLRNCYIQNTRFGISLASFDSVCEGNVVSDFSGDGIRATRSGEIVRYNIIKNVYVSARDGDDNHDDGIQCFPFYKDPGPVKNVSVVGNLIIAHEDRKQKLTNNLQGLGFFDGPLVDFVVTDNVVNVDAWHGIALYDAQNARVRRNVVWTEGGDTPRAWILFGEKKKQAQNNTASDNYANSFRLDQPGTTESDNRKTTEAIYEKARESAYKTIIEKFGAKHPATNRPKLANH